MLFSLIITLPAFAEICTPNNPVFKISPGKVSTINGVKTCVSGSCMTFVSSDPLPIIPIADVNLGSSGGPFIDFAKIPSPWGELILQYAPGPSGTNSNATGGTGICETNPLMFDIRLNGVIYGPVFVSFESIKRVQFNGNTFRSALRVNFINNAAREYLSFSGDYPTFTIEGTYSPVASGQKIDAVVPTFFPTIYAVHGSGFTKNDIVMVDGIAATVKMFIDDKLWFVGMDSKPAHVMINNASGSTIPEIATSPKSKY